MKLYSRVLMCLTITVVIMLSATVDAATLDAARRYYDEKDFKAAADEYGFLLTLNWPKAKVGGLYDAYTECLAISGNYDMAEAKIDSFLKLMPNDPVAEKLTVRKIQIADSRLGKVDTTGTLETAKISYDNGDFRKAAAQYGTALGKSTTGSADTYDRLTECQMISGDYAEANEKIDAYLNAHPADPVCEKLVARKIRMACYTNDFTSASQLATAYLSKYDRLSPSGLQVQRLYIEALGNCGRHRERVDFIEKELESNPNHPLYAELRLLQADTLATALKQGKEARLKHADAMQHCAPDSETYESSAYRMGNILLAEAKSTAKTDPQKASELTSESLHYMAVFVDHPGADKNSPANQLRRLTALKRLKRYGDMEREASHYLGDENVVNYNQVVAVKQILGEYADFQNVYGAAIPAEDQPAINAIKAAYYSDSYADTNKLVTEFLASHNADTASGRLAQRLLVGSMAKARATRELAAFVDQTLTAKPDHPMYADFRRAQADALWDMKKTSDSRAMLVDAMAHLSNDSDVYDWCCFRAGSAAMTESSQPGLDADKKAELRAIGRKYLAEYVALPSKDRIYPANVVRRMMAYNWLRQNDQMELEAARYLADRADYNNAVYLHIQRMLSTNRAMRKNSDAKGALEAFEQLRLRENDLNDVNSKVSIGISMLKSATYFASQGSPKDQVEKLRESGRKFLQDAIKDESLKLQRRMDAYYFLEDWAGLKAAANAELARTSASDSATRAELFNWIGIALTQQKPQDMEGALASFDKTLAEYDKNPQVVKERAVLAAQWAMWLWELQKNDAKAQAYLDKVKTMPDSQLKAKVINEYQPLIVK